MNTANPQVITSKQETENADRRAISEVLFSPRVVIPVVIFIAALIRIWAARHRLMIAQDETMYVLNAMKIGSGSSLDPVWTPLLSLMIAGVAQLLKDFVLSGYAIVIVLGSLLCLPVYLLGKELFDRRVGMLAAVLLAISPLFVDLSSEIYTETVYAFFLVFAVYGGWMTLKRPSLTRGALTGISLGLAYLTNPSTIYYVAVIASLILIKAWKERSRQALAALAPLLIAVVALATPYIFFLHGQLHTWTYTGKDLYGNVYAADHGWLSDTGWNQGALGLAEDGKETNIDVTMQTDGRQGVLQYSMTHLKARLKALENSIDSFEIELAPNVMFIGMLPLIGLGVFAGEWDRKRLKRFGFLLLMIAPSFVIFIFWFNGTSRIFMPFVAFFILWAAAGWQRIEQWGKDIAGLYPNAVTRHLQVVIPWIVGVAIILPVVPIIHETVTNRSFQTEYRQAGEWIRDNAGPGKTIMSIEFSAPFYADGVDKLLPYTPDNTKLTTYAKDGKVDYMVINKHDLDTYFPQLVTLVTDPATSGEWRLVDTVEQGTSQEAYIYQLTDGNPA